MVIDNINLRRAVPTDIVQMYGISCRAHLDPFYETLIPAESYEKFRRSYSPDAAKRALYCAKIARRLQDEQWNIWVAESKGTVCGYAMTVDGTRKRDIRGLFVDPGHQGRGIGQQLFGLCLDTDLPLSLDVIEANTRARSMYEKAGFQTERGSTKSFYGAPLVTMNRY